jgi:hypothetical protein
MHAYCAVASSFGKAHLKIKEFIPFRPWELVAYNMLLSLISINNMLHASLNFKGIDRPIARDQAVIACKCLRAHPHLCCPVQLRGAPHGVLLLEAGCLSNCVSSGRLQLGS